MLVDVYAEHEVFAPPSEVDIPVWRYVDLPKLISLLSSKSLWFSRADFLGDSHEGSVGSATAVLREQQYRSVGFSPGADPAVIESNLRDMPGLSRAFTRFTYVNCWHMNEDESMGMWQIYGGGGSPVAVRSTYKRLQVSLGGPEPTYLGQVRYVDPDVDVVPWGNTFSPFVHKRRAFSHERELRAVVTLLPDSGGTLDLSTKSAPGVAIPVKLSSLVESVVIGPDQPAWYEDVVRSTVAAFAPDLSVERSRLDTDPIW